jgi:UDP-N-acetylmuramoyl-L-alanyl-D-glutamate--2,6-diaminopimelate ligase
MGVMKINELLNNITNTDFDFEVRGIALSSQKIKKHWVFVAIGGEKSHGINFVENAIQNGACAILSDKNIPVEITAKIPEDVPVIVIENLGDKLEILANNFYTNAKNHKIIAITGTNGKTSIASFLSQVLSDFNVKNQIIGTLTNELTTPDIFTLYQTLHNFDGQYSILEVSSHALTQKRTKGLEFEIAIFSNLTQDHLDYHQNMENYLNAKLLICNQAKFGIFNEDDEFYNHFKDKLPHNTFGLKDIKTEVREFGFLCNIDNIIFEMNLLGDFNLSNVLAAYKTLLKLGFDKLEIIKSMANLQNPAGRMQKIDDENIWIDFAHTPDGLKNALQTIKTHYPQNNLTVVFGCGGNRDKTKRAKMGKIAGDMVDRIILTNDNPRDENPQDIIDDIILGTHKELQVMLDRKLAIEAGISGIDAEEITQTRGRGVKKLKNDECVLIAGKGAENYQIIKGEKTAFSDFEVVSEIVKNAR